MKNTIQSRILEQMKAQKISYGELQKRTGYSKSVLQRYATKKDGRIPVNRLEKIANALNVPISYLIGIDKEKITVLPKELRNIEQKLNHIGMKLMYDSNRDILYLLDAEFEEKIIDKNFLINLDKECDEFLKFKVDRM